MITRSNDIILDHDFNALKVDISDQILTITLNRPERLNTFDEGMKEDFRWIERRIEANDDIRVIIVNAEGESLRCRGRCVLVRAGLSDGEISD